MVTDYNQKVRNEYGLFSPQGLKITFKAPNMYEADSLEDFLNNGDIIKPTPWWRLLPRKFTGFVAISIPGCYFRVTGEMPKPKELIAELIALEAKILSYERGSKEERHYTEMAKNFVGERMVNAELYDGDVSLSILSRVYVPQETELGFCWVFYHPETKFREIVHYGRNINFSMGNGEKERTSFKDLLGGFEPFPIRS